MSGETVRLMIFGKLPEPGRTKTRLAPRLGPRGASRLYRAFLDDTVELARAVRVHQRELWVPRRPAAAPRLRRRYPDLPIRWQRGPDLGARLVSAFGTAFREGVDRALVVGSDHPTLPPEILDGAVDRLRNAPVVLGPSRDGGYYAVGLRSDVWPEARLLFTEIPWSTDRVWSSTRDRAREAGLEVAELPEWYDVDEPGELERLRRDVSEGSATARALEALQAGEAGDAG